MKNKLTNLKNKKKKGFTLIELLAVIIILGVLVMIAIPLVSAYISNSRKASYINTIKNVMDSAKNVVVDGKLEMYDINTTYYIPANRIKTDNGLVSPYGEITEAYIGVIYTGRGYEYYWICRDTAGQGIKEVTPYEEIDTDKLVGDIEDGYIDDIIKETAIKNREDIKILDNENEWENPNRRQ